MKRRGAAFLLAAFSLLVVSLPAWAHHGGAAYDRSKTITINKATITDFRFINPHVQIYFDAADEQGNTQHWACESPDDPAMLSRQGWTRHSVNPGDVVTIIGYPAKSGSKVMSLQKIITSDGRTLTNLVLNN